jgi:hypothetical protein
MDSKNKRSVSEHYEKTYGRCKKSRLVAADWEKIAGDLNRSFSGWNFTSKQCAAYWDRRGLNPDKKTKDKRKDWSQAVEKLLIGLHGKYGNKWAQIANTIEKNLNEKYSREQCRSHWDDKLNPAIKRVEWTPEEDKIIIAWVKKYNENWKELAEKYPERTCKQYRLRWDQALRFCLDVSPVQVAAQPTIPAPQAAPVQQRRRAAPRQAV